MTQNDNVNHPSHYADSCSIECIEAMEIVFGYRKMFYHCLITAFKYLWRFKGKNGEEDLRKAKRYIDRADMYCNCCPDKFYSKDRERLEFIKRVYGNCWYEENKTSEEAEGGVSVDM